MVEGVEKDFGKAAEWFTKAAEQGNANAQNNLGMMYKKGLGVGKDFGKAVEWYTTAAEQGKANAQNNLGMMYKKGLGVEKDFGKVLNGTLKQRSKGMRWLSLM